MFTVAHALLGLIIGEVTGNYLVAILSSLLPDLDHMISYIRHGVLKSPAAFWKTVSSQTDPWGDQRNILHNVFVALGVSLFAFIWFPTIAIPLCIGWFGHLLLDALDGSEYRPFYPFSYSFRGPVPYLSKGEWIFSSALFAIFVILLIV